MCETVVITLSPDNWNSAGAETSFTGQHLHRLPAHQHTWLDCLAGPLKHRGYLIRAQDYGKTLGEIPLMLVSGPIFGKFLCSLPYINTGGAWAQDDKICSALINKACDLADSLDVRYLELRHEQPFSHVRLNFERSDKVHMRLNLPRRTRNSRNLSSQNFAAKFGKAVLTIMW